MPTRHGLAVPRGLDAPAGQAGGRFGKLFDLPALVLSADEIDDLVAAMVGLPPDHNVTIPAGFTYLGQFIDHDITFDPSTSFERQDDPHGRENFRTPRFDLDSLYGSGPRDQPFLYDQDPQSVPGVKLLVGRNPNRSSFAPLDLPRNEQGRALIGDARNDENVIVAQLHLLFIKFHNKVVDLIAADEPSLEPAELFVQAQQFVRWHYQWIVVHQFLRLIVGAELAARVLRPGEGDAAETADLRFYTATHRPAIPIEFSAAAFRFGHSMVRASYRPNLRTPPIILFRGPGETEQHLGGLRTLPAELEIDWDLFFFGVSQPPGKLNRSNKIDPVIASRLAHLPPDGKSLVWLNLQRANALGLPSGPEVARAMARVDPAIEPLTEIDPAKLPGYKEITVSTLQTLLPRLPLWAYILLEARLVCDGERLGPVGGTIVAEVLVGLLEADKSSYLHQQPAWKPDRRLADDNRDFRMRHLLNFTLGPSTP